jgi:hypothetical protein
MIVGALLFVLGACATSESVQNARVDAGVVEAFDAPYDRVAAATLETIRGLGVNITSTEQEAGGLRVMVSKPATAFSWGEVGRIMVERAPEPPTPVRVLWEKRSQMQITGTGQAEFSQNLFAGIRQRLAL